MRKKLWKYLVSYILLICITAGLYPTMVSSADIYTVGGYLKINVSELLKTLAATGGEGKSYDLEALPEDVIAELEDSVILKKGSVNGLNYYITAEIMGDLDEDDPAACLQSLSMILINQKKKEIRFPEIQIVDDDTYRFSLPAEADQIWAEEEEETDEEDVEEPAKPDLADPAASPSSAGSPMKRTAKETPASPSLAGKAHEKTAAAALSSPSSAGKVKEKPEADEQSAALAMDEKAVSTPSSAGKTQLASASSATAPAIYDEPEAPPGIISPRSAQRLILPFQTRNSVYASFYISVKDSLGRPLKDLKVYAGAELMTTDTNGSANCSLLPQSSPFHVLIIGFPPGQYVLSPNNTFATQYTVDTSSTYNAEIVIEPIRRNLNLTVTDAQSGGVLAGADVYLKGMDSGLTQVARTDSAGMINFSNLYNERFELRTSLSGYSPNYQLVDLTTKLQLSWDIRLSHAGSHGVYDIGGNEYGLPSITDKLPAYVLKGGTWTQNEAGQWFYANGRTFTDEWAAIWNPQLDTDKGQPPFYWYHFGRDSVMTVGWLTDEDGGTYFLHNVSDGALGYLYTGWHWIDDDGDGISQCYYFETNSNGSRGRLYKSAVTPDGYTVDRNGQWIQDGRAAAKIIDR